MTRKPSSILRFAPTPLAACAHLLWLGVAFALFLGRKPGSFRLQAIEQAVPGVYTHIFNFSLSYLMYTGVGFLWPMMGVPVRGRVWAGSAPVVANPGYESPLPPLTTR